MAKKTDSEIGNKIRAAISVFPLEANETIENVRIIMAVTVKNTDSGAIYPKGGKGIELDKYDATDEDLQDKW